MANPLDCKPNAKRFDSRNFFFSVLPSQHLSRLHVWTERTEIVAHVNSLVHRSKGLTAFGMETRRDSPYWWQNNQWEMLKLNCGIFTTNNTTTTTTTAATTTTTTTTSRVLNMSSVFMIYSHGTLIGYSFRKSLYAHAALSVITTSSV